MRKVLKNGKAFNGNDQWKELTSNMPPFFETQGFQFSVSVLNVKRS